MEEEAAFPSAASSSRQRTPIERGERDFGLRPLVEYLAVDHKLEIVPKNAGGTSRGKDGIHMQYRVPLRNTSGAVIGDYPYRVDALVSCTRDGKRHKVVVEADVNQHRSYPNPNERQREGDVLHSLRVEYPGAIVSFLRVSTSGLFEVTTADGAYDRIERRGEWRRAEASRALQRIFDFDVRPSCFTSRMSPTSTHRVAIECVQ